MNLDVQGTVRRLRKSLPDLVFALSYSKRRAGPAWHAVIGYGPRDQRVTIHGNGTSSMSAISDAVLKIATQRRERIEDSVRRSLRASVTP